MSDDKIQKFDPNAILPPSLRGKMIGWEKLTGTVTGALILGGAALLGWYLLPPLIVIMKNLILLSGLCVGFGLTVAAVLHPGFRHMVGSTYAVLIRKLHNQIIKKMPYDWARFIIQQSKEYIASGSARLGKLRGANTRLRKLIEKNAQNIQDRTDQAKAAENLKRIAQRDTQLRIIGQIGRSNERLTSQLEIQDNLVRMLQARLENARLKIEEEEAGVELAIEENSAMMEAQGAASDVIAAIQRDPATAANFNLAMDTIARSTAEKLGQIEQVMFDLQPIMDDIELGKAVDLERGRRALEALSQPTKPAKLAAASDATDGEEAGDGAGKGDFQALLNRRT